MPLLGLILYSFLLLERCSNNIAKYEALIIGIELAIEMCINQLKVFSESQSIIQQLNGHYEVRNTNSMSLYQRTKNLMDQFLWVS